MGQLLKRMRKDAELLKREVKKEVSGARILIKPEVHQEISKDLLVLGSDLAVAEVLWRQFCRLGPLGKTFAVSSTPSKGEK